MRQAGGLSQEAMPARRTLACAGHPLSQTSLSPRVLIRGQSPSPVVKKQDLTVGGGSESCLRCLLTFRRATGGH